MSKEMRDLLAELHYFQNMARAELRALKKSRAKCKAIGAKMRALQKLIPSKGKRK